MKQLLIFILIVLCIIQTYQQCSFSTVLSALQQRNTYLNSFNYNSTFDPVAFQNVFNQLKTAVTPCQQEMTTLVNLAIKNVTYASDDCPFDSSYPLWATDACCNPILKDSKCCNARNITQPIEYISSFNTNALQRCSNPDKIKTSFITLLRRIRARDRLCQAAFNRKIKDVYDQLFPITQCATMVYTNRQDCIQNSDCANNLCDITQGKCFLSGADAAQPLINCIISRLPDWAFGFFRAKFGLRFIDSLDLVVQRFTSVVTTPACYEPANPGDNFNYVQNTTLTTQVQCLQQQVCNQPLVSGVCPIGNYSCVNYCGLNGVCSQRIDPLRTQQMCQTAGYCTGNGWVNTAVSPPQPFNTTSCAQLQSCSILSQCNETNGCTQAKCLAGGRCVGFPFPNGACLVPFSNDPVTFQRTCPLTATRTDFGCISNTALTQSACNALPQGQWVPTPTDQTSCESWKRCFNLRTKQYTLHTQADCMNCGNITSYQSLYRWQAPVYGPAYLYQSQSWQNASMVPLRRWGMMVDGGKLINFFNNLIFAQTIPIYKEFFACVQGPLMATTLQFACDCGDTKAPAGVNCYNRTTYPISLGNVGFAGVVQDIKTPDVEITTTSSSVSTTNDNQEITINKADGSVVSSSNPDLLRPYSAFAIDQSSNDVGTIGSDGVSVTGFTGSINICINIDPDAVVPTGYTSVTFATISSSGVLVKSSAPITSVTSSQVCGTISDQNTYYVTYWGGSITNSAVSYGIGFFVFVLLTLLF